MDDETMRLFNQCNKNASEISKFTRELCDGKRNDIISSAVIMLCAEIITANIPVIALLQHVAVTHAMLLHTDTGETKH
jgi:hypothetical protein